MKDKLILEFWDKSKYLDIKNKKYKNYVEKLIDEKLKEDSASHDITTNSLIDSNKKIKARIITRQDGVIAGLEEISLVLENNGIKIKKNRKDGDKIKNKDIILEIYGNARKILNYERVLINILQRMSGIATIAHNLTKLINKNCFISGTRKTTLDLLDKKALSVGGALTHRLSLKDSILIKDNHLKILNNNIEKALVLAQKNRETKYVEIEVNNENQALIAALKINSLKNKKPIKLFAIMFDNMSPLEIKNTIIKINNSLKNYKKNILFDASDILFEASGDINEKNIETYSKTGVDIISLGYITHSTRALNISLEIK